MKGKSRLAGYVELEETCSENQARLGLSIKGHSNGVCLANNNNDVSTATSSTTGQTHSKGYKIVSLSVLSRIQELEVNGPIIKIDLA